MAEVLSPDAISGNRSSTSTPKTADDINELFKSLDTDEQPEPEVSEKEPTRKVKTKEKEEESNEEPDELELVEPDEEPEKLDLSEKADDLDIDAPPRKKELMKEYPDIFKKHPYLEKMLYRDKQYNELFGSFDDAKEIAERAEIFNDFENQLMAGNTVEILKNVKDADEDAFNKIVDDYLPMLAKVDKDAYWHVVGNLNKRLVMEMVSEAKKTGNEDLQQAALLVHQFVFGKSEFTPPTTRSVKDDSPEKNEAEQERLAYVRERYENHRNELQSQADNTLRATISEYIDSRGVMTPYVKKNAVNDAMNYLEEAIAADPSVVKNLEKLWRSAFDSNFSKESLGKIKSYYLSKARPALRNAILKARAEALKEATPRKQEEDEEEERTPARQETRRAVAPGRPSQPKNKHEMKKGETVSDFFMRD